MKKNITKVLFILSVFQLTAAFAQADWIKIETIPDSYKDNYWLEVYFLPSDPNYGWICGFNGKVIRTTDGGLTWEGVTISGVNQLESIHFASKMVGYTSGDGNIFKSVDSGKTWEDITGIIADDQAAIWGNYFIDENNGCTVGGGCGLFSTQFFYHTTNGGATWNKFQGNVDNTGMTDVTIVEPSGLAYAVSSGYIWKSTNGGNSWSLFSETGAVAWQEDLHFYGNSFLVPYSGGCDGNDEPNSGIRMSTDAGKTWKQFRTGRSMFGTFLIDEKRGWACGFQGSIYYTSDGGDHWVLRDCGVDKSKELDDIWFINDSTGFLVGEGAVYKTFKYDTLKPEIEAIGPVKVCEGEEVTLTTTKEFPHYIWSTGEKTRSITVNKSGEYYVTVNSVRCDSSKSGIIKVEVFPKPKPVISLDGPDTLCDGENVNLSIKSDYQGIEWSDGQSGKSINVTGSGTYSVTVTDSNGCTGTASKCIHFRQKPVPPLVAKGKVSFCYGDSTYLETAPGYIAYSLVKLPEGKQVYDRYDKYYVKEEGKYLLEVTDKYGCTGWSDTVSIVVIADSNRLEMTFNKGNKTIDFDSVALTQRDYYEMYITNKSQDTTIINDVFVFRNIEFSAIQTYFPIIILPYGRAALRICFSPSEIGMRYDTLLLNDICTPHLVFLEGAGSPNYYKGASRCSLPIEIKTTKLNKPQFLANPPFPNPVKELLEIEFGLFVPKLYSQAVSADLFDVLGNRMKSPEILYESVTETENGAISYGKLIFNLSGLQQGTYYIRVNSGSETETYTITKI